MKGSLGTVIELGGGHEVAGPECVRAEVDLFQPRFALALFLSAALLMLMPAAAGILVLFGVIS